MRKYFFITMLVVFLSMVIVNQVSFGATTITIKLATVWPLEHPVSKALEEVFISEVNTGTQGLVEIQHYPNFQLGTNFEITQGLQMGSIEIAAIGNELQNAVPELAVAELPYVFDTAEDAWAKFAGPYGKIAIDAMEKAGVKHLVWYERGFREVSSNKPILSIDDMKGFKIRVSQVYLQSDMVKSWGCSPSIINWNEVYTAIQQGVVNGQENPIDTIYNNKLYEVNKYVAMTSHQFSFGYLIANLKWWNTLPEEVKIVIQEAAVKFQKRQDELLKKEYEGYLDGLKAEGATITYPDRLPFREKAPIIYEKFSERYPELKYLFEMLGKKVD